MISYVIDSSALWRLRRDRDLVDAWMEEITLRLIGSCPPQRVEFLRSARNAEEYEYWRDDLVKFFPEVALPKRIWSWIDTVQHQLAGHGVLGAVAPVDLMICATAAHHGLTILHDDRDFRTISRYVPGVVELSINSRKRGRP